MSVRSLVRQILPPLVPLVLVTLAVELAARRGWVRAYLLPPPSNVLASIVRDWPDLSHGIYQTAAAAIAGFVISVIAGVIIAIVLSSSRWIEQALYPYAVFFQTVPIIAIAPLLVIWFDWDRVVAISAFIVSVFPIIANTLAGLRSTDPALLDLFQLYGANAPGTLLKLRLPSALPSIFTGMRVAAGLAVIGAIVGEFITGSGIGGIIQVSQQQKRVDKLFAGLLLASLLGVGLFWLINLLAYLALRNWHASARDD